MREGCTFIRLLADEDKKGALAGSIDALRGADVYFTDPGKFSMVPGSPFAYWTNDKMRRTFKRFRQFEQNFGEVRMGLGTRDDFRFVRLVWEITPNKVNTLPKSYPNISDKNEIIEIYRKQTKIGKKWSFFAKGGEYSPFYSDIHLVVNWENEGYEIINLKNEAGKPKSRPQNQQYYYYPGLTWSRRTTSRFNIRALPEGVIFADLGNIIISFDQKKYFAYLGIFLSDVVLSLIKLSLGADDAAARTYDVGIIQKLPFPDISGERCSKLTKLAKNSALLKMVNLSLVETTRVFKIPVYSFKNDSLQGYLSNTIRINNDIKSEIIENQEEIDIISEHLYEIKESEREIIEDTVEKRPSPIEGLTVNSYSISASIISYIIGCVFGRWDIRYATGERDPPELPDPFAPLPACSPGMLQGEDGLPLDPHDIPSDYPLTVDDDGILVDDEGHPDDIIDRIRDVLTLIWGDRADAIEREACEILKVKTLRDYFRKPRTGGFWNDHVKRYSKSRRKAPIYWLLQSTKRNYAIWIYYPRMDGDTLYKALHYAKDKLALEEQRLEDMLAERERLGTGGATVKRLEKEIEGQEAFVSELHDFVEKLERAAKLNLIPDHDDGVVLTIAPLRELVPWNELGKYWDELIKEKYEWSAIGKQLAEKGMVKG